MIVGQVQSETDLQKPTTFQLLGDAFNYMRPNFTTFLLYGGALIIASKFVFIFLRWVQSNREIYELGAYEWPVYFLTIFLKAVFAYNVHRFVLLGQRRFSFTLGKTFWLFVAAVLAIQLAFLIPGELLEGFLSGERINGWRRLAGPTSLPPLAWFLLPPLSQIASELLIFVLIARFLIIPPGIVASASIELSVSLQIGRAFYWQIFWGLLIFHLCFYLYAFLIGLVQGTLLLMFLDFENTNFAFVSMALQSVLLAPIRFFYVLLGATFTSAVFIRGSKYLGLPKLEE